MQARWAASLSGRGVAIKFNGGPAIEAQYIEYGVEYASTSGEIVVTPCDDEGEARFIAGVMEGTIVARTVYETAWAGLDNSE